MLCLPEILNSILKYVNENSKKEIIKFYQMIRQDFCKALTSSVESSCKLDMVLKGL